MKTACVIVNYNDAETTIRLLNKINNYRAIDYIIVVDNCSTDGSYSALEKYRTDRIIVLCATGNKGYGAGNNLGIKYAKERLQCDVAIIANPDVIFTEECIEKIKYTFSENRDVAVVTALQMKSDGTLFHETAWDIPSVNEYIFSALFFIGKLYSKTKEYNGNTRIAVDCVSGAFLAVDINKFLSVDGYDERIFLYCEETMLGIKLRNAGFKTLLLTNENYVHHHAVSTQKSIPDAVKRRSLLLNSRLFVLKEYMGASELELLLASGIYKVALVEEAVKVAIKSLKNKSERTKSKVAQK